MSTRYVWRRILDGVVVEIADRIRRGALRAETAAEEGAVPIWTLPIPLEDTDDFDLSGHRILAVYEDEAEDPDDQYLAVGYIQRRRYLRGDFDEVGSAHLMSVDVADLNTILGRRVMTGADAKRPAETDVERMQWAILTNEASLIDDDTYLSTANPVNMDKADYRGQYLMNVLQDCAEASGKNYFITWLGPAFTEGGIESPWGTFSIFYDFASSEVWDSAIFLTNVLDDQLAFPTTTFLASAELERAPDQVYSGVYLPYDGGYVYDQDADTAAEFARRDTIESSINVKTRAKAVARVARYLEDLDEEDDRLTITFDIPRAKVNALRAGMRVPVRFSHLPGYQTSYRWVRMLTRTIVDTAWDRYTITGQFSATPAVLADGPGGPPDPPPDPGDPFFLGTLETTIPTDGPGNNSLAEHGDDGTGPGTLYLYEDCSYRFDFTVSHAHDGDAGATSSNIIKVQCDSSQTPVFNMGAARLGTAVSTITYTSSPGLGALHELQRTWAVIAHTAYYKCNGHGSSVSVTISYVSGPDERFV